MDGMRIARKRRFRQDVNSVLLEHGLVVPQDRAPEGVVLVDDAEALLATLADHVVHQHAEFLEVARPQIDDVRIPLVVPQKVGARDVAYERDAGRSQHRHDALRRRRPHPADNGEHVVLGDESLCVRRRPVRLISVVEGDQLQGPAVDSPQGVAFRERGADARAIVDSQLPVRTRENGALPENDGFRTDSGRSRGNGRSQHNPDTNNIEVRGTTMVTVRPLPRGVSCRRLSSVFSSSTQGRLPADAATAGHRVTVGK